MKVPSVLERVEDSHGTGRVSAELAPLIRAVYAEVVRHETDLAELHRSLKALLSFLASAAGRTHANCVATDSFFMLNDRWERGWEHLADAYQDVLGLLGEALHDTIAAPEIAENFDNTPEQLLTRLQRIEPTR